jgi:ribosomal protein S18
VAQAFSTNSNAFEFEDDFESRIFGDNHETDSSLSDNFFQKLDRLGTRGRQGMDRGSEYGMEGFDEDEDDDDDADYDTTLADVMDGKLKLSATEFYWDSDECDEEGYKFRPDVSFQPGMTYELKDLDLTKPGIRKPPIRHEFEVTTEEVLRKADFRNVRFLANFITDAGILNKRSKTGISAKAQRKVAREIKTARAFGLMPFTTMGTKKFIFGETMENVDGDYDESIRRPFRRPMGADFANNPYSPRPSEQGNVAFASNLFSARPSEQGNGVFGNNHFSARPSEQGKDVI